MASPFFSGKVDSNGGTIDSPSFSFGMALSTGDTVDFRVNVCQPGPSGPVCDFVGSNTGLKLTVASSPLDAVPEPVPGVLAAVGLAVLGALRKLAAMRVRKTGCA